MEYSRDSGKINVIILGAIVFAIFFVACFTLDLPREGIIPLFIVGILALAFEIIPVEVPYYGYASIAYPIYFFTMLYPYAGRWRGAILIAFIAILVRTLAINKQPVWFRIRDFIASLWMVIVSAIVFGFIFSKMSASSTSLQSNVLLMSLKPSDGKLISAVFISMLFSAFAYIMSDFFITTSTAGFLEESYQKIWNEVRNKIRWMSLVYFPTGLALFLTFSIHWSLALCLIPVFIILYNYLKSIIQEVVLVEQESLSNSLSSARSELSDLRTENKQITEDLQKKVDELSIVYEMSKALGASINLEETHNIILSMVRKLIIYQSCVIFLLEKGSLTPAKYVTPYKETLALSPLLQLEETIVNLVVQNRKPLLIPDMHTVNEQRIFKDEKCVMCVPLIIKEKIIGVLYVGNTKQGAYNDEQLNILSILANSAAIAIESAQLYEDKEHSLVISKSINSKLEKTVRQLSALNEFGKSLVSSLNMDETLDFISSKMKNIIDYQSFIIFTIRKDSSDPKADPEIIPKRCIGPYSELFKDVIYKISDGVLGWVISQKKPLLLEDTRDSRLPNVVSHERSSIIVPMVVENDAIGAFYVGASVANYYDEEALNLVSTVTYQTAMAVKNAELYEKMVSLAITDGLTGLYTHRYFQERLNETCREYERTLKNFSLVMVDVDNFKTYNDTLGHPEGDKLLQEIAALIKSYTRDSDLVSRYGGDEFAVILKESDKDNSVKIAERIREAFQYRFNSYKVKITSSIGVANFPMDAESKQDLLAAADAALYKSKKGGRNKVNWAVPLSETGGRFIQPEIQAPLPRAADAAKQQQQQVLAIPQKPAIPMPQNTAQKQVPGNMQTMTPQQQMQYQLQMQQQQRLLQQQYLQQQQMQQQQMQQQQIQRYGNVQQTQPLQTQQKNHYNQLFPQQQPANQQNDFGATRRLSVQPGVWPPVNREQKSE